MRLKQRVKRRLSYNHTALKSQQNLFFPNETNPFSENNSHKTRHCKAAIYSFKFNNKNNRAMCEICSKLVMNDVQLGNTLILNYFFIYYHLHIFISSSYSLRPFWYYDSRLDRNFLYILLMLLSQCLFLIYLIFFIFTW